MIVKTHDEKIILSTLKAQKTDILTKKIVVFGCTPFAKKIIDIICEWMIEPCAIIDNNKEKIHTKCMNVMVHSPEEYLLPKKENLLIIICSKYHHEMMQQVLAMDYTEENILDIPVDESNNYSDNSSENFEKNIAEVTEGYAIYQNIKKNYPSDHMLFLCPYPGTGDVYMACAYLPQYLEKEHINNYILAVNGNNCAKVARLFNIKNLEIISEHEKNLLLKAWEFLGTPKIHLKPLLFWGWRTKRHLLPNKTLNISFGEMFKYDVFGLEPSAHPVHPYIKKDELYCQNLFSELDLTPGKTVILAPYAGSFHSNIPTSEWENLVTYLLENGYNVCTNCYGENEPPIKNTKPIQFPYNQGVHILEEAGVFIGVRSGLCDILSPAKCQKIVLYENGFYASSYEYFSLKKMELCDDVHELIYDKDLTKSIANILDK